MPNLIPMTAEDFALRCTVLLIAIGIDWLVGEPAILWRRLPHPVVLCGRAIGFFDKKWNRRRGITGSGRRRAGTLAVFLLAGGAGICGWLLGFMGIVIETACVAILLAGRSLDDHIRAVEAAFDHSLSAARTAVGMIVGRSTDRLGEDDIARAAIETGAENLSDGVIAPAFWFLFLGLPGVFIYKMVNTADSMIGYKNARYFAFGWAAARLDDVLNYIPARLTALLVCGGGMAAPGGVGKAVSTMLRDAGSHASPNAGWPEAAMAGALDIWLAGPRAYGQRVRQAARLNEKGQSAERHHIGDALHILKGAQLLFAILLGFVVASTTIHG